MDTENLKRIAERLCSSGPLRYNREYRDNGTWFGTAVKHNNYDVVLEDIDQDVIDVLNALPEFLEAIGEFEWRA